jgi:hypothetical protein
MDYLSVIIYTSMILDFNELVNGSSLSLPAHGRAGARATPYLAAFFAKRKTKFGGGKARAGKNSFPPTPFLFARPSVPHFVGSEISVGIFAEKNSDFVQDRQQVSMENILYLFHHIHHSNDEHEVHHCGGKHRGLDYKIRHCGCGKHRINA